ncbi:Carboxypeptidase B [Larimichthys crocea]|uniref:Uncharacterized protein n=1 Tax=Larimichthys crocea TaxID=215358 RepID=A0ACD3R9P2_LARCR|nr:Carboxypeptidase B [Larimichthys crocea]
MATTLPTRATGCGGKLAPGSLDPAALEPIPTGTSTLAGAPLELPVTPAVTLSVGTVPSLRLKVKNVADFIRRNKSIIKAYITVHSYSQLLLFPYSYTYDLAADHSELLKVAQGASAALRSLYGTRYTSGPGAATIYPAAGGSDDWAYDLGVKYSYTFELRDTGRYGFLLPESQIKPTCEETMLAVKYIAAYVQKNLY